MENSGSTERKRNNYIISRSGKFKPNKKRIQITEEFWIDPALSSKPLQPQPQQNAVQNIYRDKKDIKDLNQHSSSDNDVMSLTRKFQNFSSSSSQNNIANSFIKSDKKLSTDKQQNRETGTKSNQTKSDYLRSGNAT